MKKIIVFLLMSLWGFSAQAVQILATVQDEIITDLDVNERAALIQKMFNAPTDESLKKNIFYHSFFCKFQKYFVSLHPNCPFAPF
jgi:hypothetical protein